MTTAPDYYDILGVPATATVAQIRSAHLRQIRKWHPDRNADPRATERTTLINVARDVLLDPARRALYDRTYRPAAPAKTPPRSAPRTTSHAAEQQEPRAEARRRTAERAQRTSAAEQARAAAERQRREAASARARRAAETRRKRTAATGGTPESPAPVPPLAEADAARLGWLDEAFVPGHWYAGPAGLYEVLALSEEAIEVRFASGARMRLPAAGLWLQWLAIADAHAEQRGPEACAVLERNRTAADRPRAEAAARAKQEVAARVEARRQQEEARVRREALDLGAAAPPEHLIDVLVRGGWATLIDNRDAGGALWLMPTIEKESQVRALMDDLRQRNGAFPFRYGRGADIDDLLGWRLIR